MPVRERNAVEKLAKILYEAQELTREYRKVTEAEPEAAAENGVELAVKLADKMVEYDKADAEYKKEQARMLNQLLAGGENGGCETYTIIIKV